MTEVTESISPRREVPRSTEGELPETKIFDLLSSVGNGENKALELIVMREGYSYSKSAFHHEVMEHQGENPGWRMAYGLPFDHCERSLSPIGLVTKEALRSDDTAWGYQITKYGIDTGIPFAGALLKWSYEHPKQSLYKMFGSTTSAAVKDEQTLDRKRAPETRYKIFWELATNSSSKIRQADIANETSENSGLIGSHLESLSRYGVMNYDSVGGRIPFSYFKRADNVPDKDPETYSYYKTLTSRVWNLLSQPTESRQSEYLSIGDAVNSLINQYPEYEELQRLGFSRTVTNILSNLEKQGYAQREKFNYFSHSDLTLTEGQKEAIVSLVTIIDKFMIRDTKIIEEGRRFAQRIASDPKLYSDLMLKAKEASPHASRTSREEIAGLIRSILYENPNYTASQIQQVLRKDFEKELSVKSMRKYLLRLTNEGRIVAKKTNDGNAYSVAESKDQQQEAILKT